MSTQNETCKKELPHGSKLLTTVQPTGKPSNKEQKTKVPLAPENVTAIYNSDKTKITINLTVYIDSAVKIKTLDIYEFLNAFPNLPTRVFYIVYDYKAETPKSLKSYSFSFVLPCNSKPIKSIETVLWNEDPEASRGTVTTVKDSSTEDVV